LPLITGFGMGLILIGTMVESTPPVATNSLTNLTSPAPILPQRTLIVSETTEPIIVPPVTDHALIVPACGVVLY